MINPKQNNQSVIHKHNFNDVGIHIIYCSNSTDGNICEYAKDKETDKIEKFTIVNGQGRLDYDVCYNENKSIGCCHKKTEKCECDCHYERKKELEILGQLIFSNPCNGCLNMSKSIKILPLKEYQQLCLTHREIYENWLMTVRRDCSA